MDPFTLATSFATIVGLLGAYKAERREAAGDEFQDFMQWLAERNHTEIRSLLELNTQATIGIKSLLNQDRELLFQRLGDIDEILSLITSRIEGFSQITSALRPNAEISEQAVSVLKQLIESGGSKFLKSGGLNRGPSLHIIDGKGEIEYEEGQFIEDDLHTLVDLGLLNQDYNSMGDPLYIITRAAVKFLAAIQ